MNRVNEACDMAIKLNEMKQDILSYVQSRMSFIAPNLTIIVGASTAAKLMGKFTSRDPLILFCIWGHWKERKWTCSPAKPRH